MPLRVVTAPKLAKEQASSSRNRQMYTVVHKAILRTGRDRSSKKCGELQKGATLQVLEKKMVNGILRVRLAGGWTSMVAQDGTEMLKLVSKRAAAHSMSSEEKEAYLRKVLLDSMKNKGASASPTISPSSNLAKPGADATRTWSHTNQQQQQQHQHQQQAQPEQEEVATKELEVHPHHVEREEFGGQQKKEEPKQPEQHQALEQQQQPEECENGATSELSPRDAIDVEHEHFSRLTALHAEGAVFLGLGQNVLAISRFSAALSLASAQKIDFRRRQVSLFASRAAAYHHCGQLQQAIEDYNAAVQLEPPEPPSHRAHVRGALRNRRIVASRPKVRTALLRPLSRRN
eukprot:SAG11_NODE_295_length_11115_cov_14.005264_3_plen_346_part_00